MHEQLADGRISRASSGLTYAPLCAGSLGLVVYNSRLLVAKGAWSYTLTTLYTALPLIVGSDYNVFTRGRQGRRSFMDCGMLQCRAIVIHCRPALRASTPDTIPRNSSRCRYPPVLLVCAHVVRSISVPSTWFTPHNYGWPHSRTRQCSLCNFCCAEHPELPIPHRHSSQNAWYCAKEGKESGHF